MYGYRGNEPPLISTGSLLKILGKYVYRNMEFDAKICNFNEDDDAEREGENVLRILIGQNEQLGIYGKPTDLAFLLREYRRFTGSRAYFDLDTAPPYNTHSIIYRSVTSKSFMFKQDILASFQMIISSRYCVMKNPLCRETMTFFLRKYLLRLERSIEMVTFNSNDLTNLSTQVSELMVQRYGLNPNSQHECLLRVRKATFEELLPQWSEVFKVDNDDGIERDLKPFAKVFEKICKRYPIRDNEMCYQSEFYFINSYCKAVRDVIRTHPQYFALYPEKLKCLKPKLRRLGTQADAYFLLSEVYTVANNVKEFSKDKKLQKFRENYAKEIKDATAGKFLLSIKFEDFIKSIGNEINGIELILIPKHTYKHRSHPILKEDGTFCFEAGDVLMEVLDELINGYRLFQWPVEILSTLIEPFFNSLQPYFCSEMPLYFLDQKYVDQIYNLAKKTFDIYKDQFATKTDGEVEERFSIEDLRYRLNHLSLTQFFPQIAGDVAERVFNLYQKIVTEETCRIDSLSDAVTRCQIICILQKFPNLDQFCHNQLTCMKVYSECKCFWKLKKKWNKTPVSKIINKIRAEAESMEASKSKGTSEDCKSTGNAEKKNGENTSEIEKPTASKLRREKKKLKKAELKNKELLAETENIYGTKDKCVSTEAYRCEQCEEDEEMIETAKSKIISLQNKAAKLEKAVSKNEKKIEEAIDKESIVLAGKRGQSEGTYLKDERIKALEEQLSTQKNDLKETPNLRKHVGELEKKLTEMKSTFASYKKKIEDTELHRNRTITYYENEMASVQNLTQQHKKTLSEMQQCAEATTELRKLEQELEDEEREVQRFHAANSQLRLVHEFKDKNVQNILTLNPALVASPPIRANVMNNSTQAQNHGANRLLQQLILVQNRIFATDPMRNATMNANHLIRLADTEQVKMIAKNELKRFYAGFKEYTDSLESNIQKLKAIPNIPNSEIRLPSFPSFSENFMDHMNRLAELHDHSHESRRLSAQSRSVGSPRSPAQVHHGSQNVDPAQGEIEDLSCLVCHDPMHDINNTLKCAKCRRRYHIVCIEKWFIIQHTCPACNRLFLSENEYPAL